ncbi:MAG TPA: hypothetical protein VM031_03790, partial [Phycisphaerae bacterium]|nr:hypothetical protein [Phycisphaerae bacterium]
MAGTKGRLGLVCVIAAFGAACCIGAAAELKVVGVLGNSAGLSARPVPYAFYTGLALDAAGRLYMAGAKAGVVVCDQDGRCLAVEALPKSARGFATRSRMVAAGGAVFCVARPPQGGRSALVRIDTSPADAAALKAQILATGEGEWAISPTPDAAGRILVGQ